MFKSHLKTFRFDDLKFKLRLIFIRFNKCSKLSKGSSSWQLTNESAFELYRNFYFEKSQKLVRSVKLNTIKSVGYRAPSVQYFDMKTTSYVQFNYCENFGLNNLLSELDFIESILIWILGPGFLPIYSFNKCVTYTVQTQYQSIFRKSTTLKLFNTVHGVVGKSTSWINVWLQVSKAIRHIYQYLTRSTLNVAPDKLQITIMIMVQKYKGNS